MKRFTLKRITALVLALVMTLSLLPVSAFAVETNKGYEDSSKAYACGSYIFTGIDEDGKLCCDNSLERYYRDGERVYITCDNITSRTVYLAEKQGETLTVSGVSLDQVGTWINDDDSCTYNVYELSVTGNNGIVEYTVTRSYDDNGTPSSEFYVLTFDFHPTFTGNLCNMECGVAIFSYVDANNVLGYDATVMGNMGSATVVCTGKNAQTVYLAARVGHQLTVDGCVTPPQVGTWYCDNLSYKVYALDATKDPNQNTVVYTVTCLEESFPLTFDFSENSGNTGNTPFVHNGVEVYTDKAEGKGNYADWATYDGLEIVSTGSNGEGQAVGVYYTPGQTKKLFLKTSDSAVTLSGISNGGFMSYATLGNIEDSTGVYELTLSGEATGNGNVWVAFGSGDGIDFMFMEQSSSGDNQTETEYPLYVNVGDETTPNYQTTFRGDINATLPYGLQFFIGTDAGKVKVTSDYKPSWKGNIGSFTFGEGSDFQWDTTGATDTEGYLEVRHDDVPNTVYRMKVTLNTQRNVFTYQGVDIYTSYDPTNNELSYGDWNYDDLELIINGGGGVSLAAPCTSEGESANLYLKPASGYTLSLPDFRTEYTNLSAVDTNGVYVLTMYQLDRNTSVQVLNGEQFIGEIDILFSGYGSGGDNGNMDKFYTTSRGNSLIRVRLSNDQAKVVSLPDTLNENDELIVTVHNVDNKEVWRPLLDDNMNLAVCYEFDELNVAENPDTATLPDVFHMCSFDYGDLEDFIGILERDVANGATFDTYNQFGSTRQNGNFFAWASSNPGDITILPTDRDDTYGWVFRYKNEDGSYSYAYDGFVMKFVLEEGADEPIVLEEIKYPAVAADRVAFVPNYASAHVNLEKVLSISEAKSGVFTYVEDGVLNYVYKGSETAFQAIQNDVLAAAALDGFEPDEWDVLYYDLLNVTAPDGYTAKELSCSYYKQSFGSGVNTMTLRYHWRGASTDLDFLLTWVDSDGKELVEKITIRMPKVEGGQKWMDLVATPVELGRVEFTQPGDGSGALNSYTADNFGVLWTQYDNDEMVDVDAVLASTVRFLAPTIDGKTATHYQFCYYGDGSDDPTLNLNNEWLAERIVLDSSLMEVVDGGTHPERIRGLLKQTYGEYDEIVYYYSADRHTRGYFVRWYFGDGVEPVTEYIQLDTSSYFCQWESKFGETDTNMPSVDIETGDESSEYAFLLTRIHPQKENGKYFFELSVVDAEGNTSVIDDGDTFRVILPYSFMGVDTNGEAWTYEKVLAAGMKDPIINHYDDTYKKLQGNKGAVKGTFTKNGIEFVVDSFSPFMLTWNDPNAPKTEAQLYIGYENQNGFEWQERANCPLGRTSSFKLGFKANDNYVAFTADELKGYEIKCSVGNITYDENGVATWNISGVPNSTFGTLEVVTGSTVYRAQMVVSPGYEPMFLVDERGAHSGTWADGGQTHTFNLYADTDGAVAITPTDYAFSVTNANFTVTTNGDAVDVKLPFATRGEEYGYLVAVEKSPAEGETAKKYQFEITAFNNPFCFAGAEFYTTMDEVDGGILLGYKDWSNFDGLRTMINGGGGTSVLVPFESGQGKTVYMVAPDGIIPNPSAGGSVMPTITPVTGVANLYEVKLGTDVTNTGGVWIEFIDDEGNYHDGIDMIFDCGGGGGNGPIGNYGVEIFTSYGEHGFGYDRPDWGGVLGSEGIFTVSSTPGEADVLYLISESELSQPSAIDKANGDDWEELTGVLNADDSRHAYKMTVKPPQNNGARTVEVQVNDKKLTFTFRFDAFCYLGGEFYTKMTGNAEDGYTLGYVKAPAEFDYLHVYYDEQDNNMMLRLPYEPGAEATVYVKAPSVITDMKIEGGGLENIATISKVATFDGYNCFAITLPEGSNENGGVVFVQSYVSDGKAGNFLLCFMPNDDGGGNGGGQNNYPPLFVYAQGQDGEYDYFNGTGFSVGGVQELSLYLGTYNEATGKLESFQAVSKDNVTFACSGENYDYTSCFSWSTETDKKNVLIFDTRSISVTGETQVQLLLTKGGETFKLDLFLHPGGNQGGPVELNGVQIFTSFTAGKFDYNDGDARPWVQNIPNGPTMAFIPMLPKSDYTLNVVKSVYLVTDKELSLLTNDAAVFGNATLTLTDITLNGGWKVYLLQVQGQSMGTEGDISLKIGNSDNELLLHFRAQWNGQDMSCWKDYVTPSGNSTVTVHLSPDQAQLITLPESINANNELIITVHNAAANNDAVWEALANRMQGFLVPFEYRSVEPVGMGKPQVKSIGTGYTIEKSLEMLEDEEFKFSNYYQGGGGVRMNGLFFAWSMEDAGRTIIVPTEESMTGAWIWRYEDNASVGGYTDKKDGVIVKFVLDENIGNAVTMEKKDAEYVAESQIKELNYPTLKPFIDFARTNEEPSYTGGTLTYQYKGEKTNYNAVTAELRELAETHNDTSYPKITLKDEQGGNILAYPLLEISAPAEGYRIKSVATEYNDNNYDNGASVVLWYDWWGPGSEVTYTLTWVDADTTDSTNLVDRVQQITIKTPSLSSGEVWMDHINDGENHATPVPADRLILAELADGCGAQHVYTPGYLLTEFDNTNTNLDVKEILSSTIAVKAPEGAKGYRLTFSSDGNDDPTYNGNNAWAPKSFQENIEAADLVVLADGEIATKTEPLEDPLRKQVFGDIEYYYSADRGTRLMLLKWIYDLEDEDNEAGDANQDPTYEYIQMDTTPYYCTLKSTLSDVGDKEVVNKPMADVTQVPEGDIYLETRIHPQEEKGGKYGQYFFELRLVDGEGNTYIEYHEDGYTIILPYSFMGEEWNYEMAKNLKEKPIINHYDKNFNLKKDNGAIKGEYTERGIEFVVDSFSPFMLTWDEAAANNTGGTPGTYYPTVTPDKTETTEAKPTTPATTPSTTAAETDVAVPEANEVVSELPAGISEFAAGTVAEVLEGDPSVIEFSEGVTVADVEKAIAEDALTIEVESVVLSAPDADDVAKVEEVLTETAGLAPGVKPVYLDLTVSIMHGERKLGELTVTQEPVKFTVGLDDSIYQAAKEGKYIYVIRIHDGITEFLDVTLDMAKKTASFFSDRFSTYALVALDAPIEVEDDTVAPDVAPPDEPVDDAAPSGTSPVIWVVLGVIAVLAIACVIVVLTKRRKV